MKFSVDVSKGDVEYIREHGGEIFSQVLKVVIGLMGMVTGKEKKG